MGKINVENLKCFESVASVLGKNKAKRELFKAVNYDLFLFIHRDSDDLYKCFVWKFTPQGHEFWKEVHGKIRGYTESINGE